MHIQNAKLWDRENYAIIDYIDRLWSPSFVMKGFIINGYCFLSFIRYVAIILKNKNIIKMRDELLNEITENYLNSEWINPTLLSTLEDLDERQLQLVLSRIKEVEENYGDCKLSRVIDNRINLSVKTDHSSDSGVTYDSSMYR